MVGRDVIASIPIRYYSERLCRSVEGPLRVDGCREGSLKTNLGWNELVLCVPLLRLEKHLRRAHEEALSELRALVPSDTEVDITMAADPIRAAWRGGSIFAASDGYAARCVTRDEYHEHGHALCRRRFGVADCTV